MTLQLYYVTRRLPLHSPPYNDLPAEPPHSYQPFFVVPSSPMLRLHEGFLACMMDHESASMDFCVVLSNSEYGCYDNSLVQHMASNSNTLAALLLAL